MHYGLNTMLNVFTARIPAVDAIFLTTDQAAEHLEDKTSIRYDLNYTQSC